MSKLFSRDFALRLGQGFLIGMGGILPGVSGALLAVLFGVYRPMMEVLSHPRRALGQYWRLFLPLALGAAVGFLGGAGGLLALFYRSQTVAISLFLGLILGTLPSLWRNSGQQGRYPSSYLALALSFALVLSVFLCLRFGVFQPVPANFFGFLLAGAIIAFGFLVPGLTASPVLMAVDLFEPLVNGAVALDFSVLFPAVLGGCAVVALLARFFSYLFRVHYPLAYHAVFGLVAATMLSILPTHFSGLPEALASLACAVLGAALALWSATLENKKSKNTKSV